MAGEPLITVVGNLVADPEPRISQGGKPWVTFRIANTPRVRDRQSGDYTDGESLWLGCRAFGDLADHIAQSLTKGTRVIVQGRLSQQSYEKDGQQRTGLNLEVDAIGPELRFATATVQKASQSGSGGGYQASTAQQSQQAWNAPQNGAQDPGGFGGGFDTEKPF